MTVCGDGLWSGTSQVDVLPIRDQLGDVYDALLLATGLSAVELKLDVKPEALKIKTSPLMCSDKTWYDILNEINITA